MGVERTKVGSDTGGQPRKRQRTTKERRKDLADVMRSEQRLINDPPLDDSVDDQSLVGESEGTVRRGGSRGHPPGSKGLGGPPVREPLNEPLLADQDKRVLEESSEGDEHREPEPGFALSSDPEEAYDEPRDDDDPEVMAALEPPDLDELVDELAEDESLTKSPSELAEPRRGRN